jgi:nitroreductase
MDVLEAIFTRRSIRKFTGEPVTDQELETILRAGFQAPSAHNYQPWEFIVLRDKINMGKIAKVHTYAKMLTHAEACIIVCGDKIKQTMTGFLVEDCSAAIQNILLAAHGIGLGAVWCGLYPVPHLTQEVERVCSLPDHIVPIGMVVIGHKGEEKKIEDRYDSAKLHYELW